MHSSEFSRAPISEGQAEWMHSQISVYLRKMQCERSSVALLDSPEISQLHKLREVIEIQLKLLANGDANVGMPQNVNNRLDFAVARNVSRE